MTYQWLAVYDRFNALSQWGEFLVKNGEWKFDQPITVPWLARSITPVKDTKTGWIREPMIQNRDLSVEFPNPKKESIVTIFSQEKMKPDRLKMTDEEQDLTIGFEVPKSAIDREKVRQIVLLEDNADVPLLDRKPALICHIPEGARFILFNRIYRKTDLKTGADVGEPIIVWCLGCQSMIRGKNTQYVSLLWPDGRIEMVDRFVDKHPYFHPRGTMEEDGRFIPTVHAAEGEEWDFSV